MIGQVSSEKQTRTIDKRPEQKNVQITGHQDLQWRVRQ